MVSDFSNRSRRHSSSFLLQGETESTVTYKLDKNSNNDEYNSATITVIPDQKTDHTYCIYRHTAKQLSHLESTKVLYKNKLITIVPYNTITKQQDILESLDGKIFSEISTYSLKTDADDHLLIKLTTDTNNEYFLYRYGSDANKWRQLGLNELVKFSVISNEELKSMDKQFERDSLGNLIKKLIVDNNKTKLLLDHICFEVNFIVALLEKKNMYKRDEISRVLGSDKIPSLSNDYRIFVNEETNKDEGKCIKSERYKLYKQHLHELGDELENKAKVKNLYIQLYLFNNRIKLYDSTNGDEKLTLIKYDSDNKYINVFFYDEDPRPLLICIGKKAYRPLDMENYLNKWIEVSDIGQCDCKGNTENKTKFLSVLSETLYIMNPVKINQGLNRDTENGTYITQTLNNDHEKVGIKMSLYSWELNCYKCYKHELGKPSYTLGEIIYNENKLFTNYEKYLSSISPENKSKSLGEIIVYYYMYDGNHEHPLMIELKYEGAGMYTTYSSDYYKLTSKDPIKKWAKMEESYGESDENFISKVKNIRNEMNREMGQMTDSTVAGEYYGIDIEVPTKSANNEQQLTSVLERKLDEIRNDLNISYIIRENNLIMSANKCTKNNSGVIAGTVTALGLVGTGSGILIYKYQYVIVSYLRSLFN